MGKRDKEDAEEGSKVETSNHITVYGSEEQGDGVGEEKVMEIKGY